MPEGEQQLTSPQQPETNIGLNHQKVLRPSDLFIEEMKASQQVQPNQPQAIPQSSAPTAQSPQPRPTPSQIYPDVTPDLNVSLAAPAQAEVSPGEPRATDQHLQNLSKVVIVRIVAGLMIAVGAGNAINWLTGPHNGFYSVTDFIGISVSLILAVGLFQLSETARSIFVYLSAIILVFSAINLAILLASMHSMQSNLPSTALELKADENALKQSYSNTSLTPAQRAQNQQDLQNDINRLSGSPTTVAIKQYVSVALLFASPGIPLIFFTRPGIKSVFK